VKVVEKSLEVQLVELLRVTSKNARIASTRRWLITFLVAVLFAVAALVVFQYELDRKESAEWQTLATRCEQRNAQDAAVRQFVTTMKELERSDTSTPASLRARRVEAYETLTKAYEQRLDCTIYVRY
jgi:hypothetical protein